MVSRTGGAAVGQDMSDPYRRHLAYAEEASGLAALPRDALAAGLAAALSRAYAAGAASSGKAVASDRPLTLADLSPSARVLGESLARRPGARLRQGAVPLPGLPWHMVVDGRPVREGRYALRMPDAAVREMAALGLLAQTGEGTLAAAAALADVLAGGAVPRPAWAGP